MVVRSAALRSSDLGVSSASAVDTAETRHGASRQLRRYRGKIGRPATTRANAGESSRGSKSRLSPDTPQHQR